MPLTTETANAKDRRTGLDSVPQMQHRHFAAIAAIISAYDRPWAGDREYLAKCFADFLAGSNPRFDRERFLKACR